MTRLVPGFLRNPGIILRLRAATRQPGARYTRIPAGPGYIICGAALVGLTLAALSLHVPGSGSVGTAERYRLLVWLLCAAACVYLVSVVLLLRQPPARRAVWLVVGIALAMRVPLLASPPFLSSDINRYVWDGRVQAAGINPYCCIPDDPALASLRDEAVWPHINRRDYAPTIYPPFAQVLFGAVARAWPTVTGMKLLMGAFDLLTMLCLWRLLRAAALPAERLLIYAWNPLVAWAFAGDGHVDAAVAGLLALALWLRTQRRDTLTGMALGLAVATKFLPAVVAPALWRRRDGWRMAAAASVTVAALYALYIGAGWRVLGFLGGYGQEEGLADGHGFWLLSILRSSQPAAPLLYLAVLGICLALLGYWVAFVRRPDNPVSVCGCAGALMAVLIFGLSPHYPWYFAWLAVPAVLAPHPALLWLSAAPVLAYQEGYGDTPLLPTIIFAPALAIAAWQMACLCLAANPRMKLARLTGRSDTVRR